MKVSDRELMLYFDGELGPGRSGEIACARRRDPSIDARLARFARVGEVTRAWARRHRIERARVVEKPPRVPSLGRRWAVGALAAAALLVAAHAGDGAREAQPTASADCAREPTGPVRAVAVDSVNFGERAGAVFHVPANDGETTVVWLSDDTPVPPTLPL